MTTPFLLLWIVGIALVTYVVAELTLYIWRKDGTYDL